MGGGPSALSRRRALAMAGWLGVMKAAGLGKPRAGVRRAIWAGQARVAFPSSDDESIELMGQRDSLSRWTKNGGHIIVVQGREGSVGLAVGQACHTLLCPV